MSVARDAALAYAVQGWPVFPCGWRGSNRKCPLTSRGFKEATTNAAVLRSWWRSWPLALIGIPTGRASGFIVLDVDVKPEHDGRTTLKELGFPELPHTPRVRTASGGFHIYFALPEKEIRNTVGQRGRGIGKCLDWRGEGGYVIVPSPGSGYVWEIDFDAAPLPPVPAVLMPGDAVVESIAGGVAASCSRLTNYGEGALRSAAEKILSAPNGEQEATLNGECYSIGRLAGAGGVPTELALDILLTAAKGMHSYTRSVGGEARRPWKWAEIEKKVRRAFAQGLGKPRPEWVGTEEDQLALARAMEEAGDA